MTAANESQKRAKFERVADVAESRREARVVRSGREAAVASRDVLVGDLVRVEAGDVAPADAIVTRVAPGEDIIVDESHLTGEPDDVPKGEAPAGGVPKKSLDFFLASGSKVLEGRCECLVVAVGERSRSGRVAALASSSPNRSLGLDDRTPLQKKLEALADTVGRFGLVAGALTFVVLSAEFAWSREYPWYAGGDASALASLVASDAKELPPLFRPRRDGRRRRRPRGPPARDHAGVGVFCAPDVGGE